MSPDGKANLSHTFLEIGRRFYPRRYRRFPNLRQNASEWARTLDWQNNPYDRYLLRREILRHLESQTYNENVFTFASRAEITRTVDCLMDEFSNDPLRMGVFDYVLILLPWRLAFEHGLVQYSLLHKALASLPSPIH